MNKLEKKFGKYAIPNLTMVLIIMYIIGYLLELINPEIIYLITLDPYRIIHGQVWRLISWLLIPPSGLDFFTIIMLFFYYSIGTVLERTWGTFRYNVYLLGGIFLTIIASFLCMGTAYLMYGEALTDMVAATTFLLGSTQFSTYFINMSIFLAYAITYPDMQVLLMFIIPVKVKWMGILDVILMLYYMVQGNLFTRFAVGAALLNVLLFYLSTKSLMHLQPKQVKRRVVYKQQVRSANKPTKHKCAICGQTDEDNPELEFRFCSKCNGNYEFCQNHLFTHEHFK